MKKSRIFATVIYFIFTFGIGVVFAITLPGYFVNFTIPAEMISEALERGDTLTALVMAEPIGFTREPVLKAEFDGGGVVLYEAVTEYYEGDAADRDSPAQGKLIQGMLYKCYAGYVYGAEGKYDVFATENNGTSLRVTTAEGKETVLPLLDYDSNGDGKNDGISVYKQKGFIFLEIRESDVSSIKKLAFTDKTGATVITAEAENALTFESALFDCFGDIEAYNGWVKTGSTEGVTESARQEAIDSRNQYVKDVEARLTGTAGCVYTRTSEEYTAARSAVTSRANTKAIPFIIIYFVAIYIIADFLLGTHYIIRFFKWFLFKVCKLGGKKRAQSGEVFGHDYYSMVTLSLDISEVPDFNGSVSIKYTGEGEEYVFTLIRSENYSTMLRMKAGVYVNPFIEIDRAYGPVDLPENLEVEGYQTHKIIKIVKREEQRL